MLAALAGLTIAACQSKSTPAAIKPSRIFAGPAGLVAAGNPEASGSMWLLAGTSGERTLQLLDLGSGQLAKPLPESANAVTLAQATSGDVIVGLATATTGAIEFRGAPNGQLLSTTPIGAPVRSVAIDPGMTMAYVLNGTLTSASVTVFHWGDSTPITNLAAPADATAIAPSAAGDIVYTAEPSGNIDAIPVRGGPLSHFQTGVGARALAVNPNGGYLYVLKGLGAAENIAVVNLATGAVTSVLPAAADSVGLAISPDGTLLFDVVGDAGLGNVQAITLPTG